MHPFLANAVYDEDYVLSIYRKIPNISHLLTNKKFPPNISPPEYKPHKNKVGAKLHDRSLNLSKTGKCVNGHEIKKMLGLCYMGFEAK